MEVDTVVDAAQRLAQLEQALQDATTSAARAAALERLVAAFPLLYGYWIKLIEKAADPTTAWDRALKRCPTIELWTAYLESSEGSSAEAAQRAVVNFGQHFQAEPLWDAYLARTEEPSAEMLDMLLRTPLYAYSKYFQYVFERQLRPTDELAQQSEETAAGVTARWEFESRIQRFYFHTLPLERTELEAWDTYLDFEESEGDAERINVLYTRCLTATALYAGFWIRWIRWLSVENDTQRIDGAFTSAFHYHPTHAQLKLLHLRTLEARGELDKCRSELVEGGNVSELVAFDLRHKRAPESTQVYAVELAKQTGDMSQLSEETRKSSAMFNVPTANPRELFHLWKQGLCPDARAYAARLKAAGALAEFFAVDSTLGYGL